MVTILVFQAKNVKEIEKQLNADIRNICEWFVNSKFSIHFGADTTKSILFGSKPKIKKLPKLNITYKNTHINQNFKGQIRRLYVN